MKEHIVNMVNKKIKKIIVFLLACACLNAQIIQDGKEAVDNFKAKKTICAISGAIIDIESSTAYSDYNGVRYYFASPAYKAKFDASSFKYANDIITCVVCGTQENRKTRTFLEQKQNRKSYFLCCPAHKEEFEKNSKKYLAGKDTLKVNQVSENYIPPSSTVEEKTNLSGLEIKVEDFNYDKTYINGKGVAVNPGEGSKFVILSVSIKNIQMKEMRSLYLSWNLFDDKGYAHKEVNKSTISVLKNPLQPESSVTVSLVFEMSKDRVPLVLEGGNPGLGKARAVCQKKADSK